MSLDPATLANLASSLNKFIVTPLNSFGVGGFVFDIEAETSVNLTAEITDHFTENNVSIQDHIAIKPKKITLKSYVGEVRDAVDPNTGTFPQVLTQKLTALSQFLPQLSNAETQAQSLLAAVTLGSTSDAIQSIANDGVNLWNFVKNSMPTQTRQAQAYAFFKALYEKKILVSVQTPFEFMSQMAIESIIAMQPEESKNVSHFTIILKEIRFASTFVEIAASTAQNGIPNGAAAPLLPVDREALAQGRTAVQISDPSNVGITPGIDPAIFAPSGTPSNLPPAFNPAVTNVDGLTKLFGKNGLLP